MASDALLTTELNAVRARWENTPDWCRAPNGKPSALTPFQWSLVRTPTFKRWFGDWEASSRFASQAVDANGEPRVFYHGTVHAFDSFEQLPGHDAGLHFGTLAQASMRVARAGAHLIPVFLNVRNPRRSRDKGAWHARSLAVLRRNGQDGVVYLNRYEGVSTDSVVRASEAGVDVDRLSPAQFRAWFPEAEDSWIVLSNDQLRSAITGGCFEPAQDLLPITGRRPDVTVSEGPRTGRRHRR